MKTHAVFLRASLPLFFWVIALLMGTAVSFSAHSMGVWYSDEVYTSRTVGAGHEVDGSVYFLMDYALYRRPQGIARFPDGGTVRHIFHEIFLCRADREDASVHNLLSVMPGGTPGLDVRASYFEVQGDLLMVLFKTGHGTRNDPGGWHAVGWNTRTDAPESLSEYQKRELLEQFTYDGGGRVRINETTALLDRATLQELELPTPLDHMSRSDRQYRNDLVELRGDRYYRRAIIEAIAEGDIRGDPEDILSRMERKRRSLEEPYRSLYEMRAAEVIESLEALNE